MQFCLGCSFKLNIFDKRSKLIFDTLQKYNFYKHISLTYPHTAFFINFYVKNKNKVIAKILGENKNLFKSTINKTLSRFGLKNIYIVQLTNLPLKNLNLPRTIENLDKDKYNDLEMIAMPQCVVPFRDSDIFDKCINFLLNNKEYDSVVTIRRTGYIPEALMKIEGDSLKPYFLDTQSKASGSRQNSEAYEIDHGVECFRYASWASRDKGIKPWSYLGQKIKGLKQKHHNHNCFVDVHTMDDIRWLEFITSNLGYKGMKKDD